MKKDQNLFSRMASSFKSMFAGLFSPKANREKNGLSVLEEEAITSPTKVIWRNFLHDKLARIGLCGFAAILAFSFIGSIIYPIDALQTETIMKYIGPGRNYLKYDSRLETEGVAEIGSGVSFSIALTNEGNVYGWGVDQQGVLTIPEELAEEEIVDIAVGDKHALALTKGGKVIGWGYDNFNQTAIPTEVNQLVKREGVVKVLAGEQYSAVLTKNKKLYIWGSTMSSKLDIVPTAYQGRIIDADTSTYNMIVLLEDGTVGSLGVAGNDFSNIPAELTDGTVNVVDVAISFRNGLALDDQGKMHVWGSSDKGMNAMPAIDEKIVKIDAGKNSFSALGESGKIYTWGSNDLGEQEAPAITATTIYNDYFQNYAIDENGKISTWGNEGYLLGTDEQGRDLFGRLIHGGKVTLIVGFVAAIISGVIGIVIGMISGFKGGWVDNVLMRIAEIFSSIPFMPLVITLSAFLGTNMNSDQKMYLVMAILGFIAWPGLARLVRAQILIEREKDFVLAARALGIKERAIIIRHILPNVLNICIVNITLSYAGNMLTESGLSFLGFGVQPPMPSWGNMLTAAQKSSVIELYWWCWILPAVCILIAAFSINLIGDGLRSALDPKANEK